MPATEFSCYTCQQLFASKYARDKHTGYCVSSVSVSYANKVVIVERNTDGQFACYCSSKGCPQDFSNAKAIQQHARIQSSEWMGYYVSISEKGFVQ